MTCRHVALPRKPHLRSRWLVLFLSAAALAMLAIACTNQLVPRGGWSAAVQDNDYLYVGTLDGLVIRVDAANGQIDPGWKYPPGDSKLGAIYGTPFVRDGIVFGAGIAECKGNICRSEVFALDAGTATPAWSEGEYTVPSKIVGPAAAGTSTLVFGTGQVGKESTPSGYLYALDPTRDAGLPLNQRVQARQKWRLPVDGAVVGGATVVDDVAYVGTMNGRLYAVDLRDEGRYAADPQARVLWTFEAEGAIAAQPLVKDGRIYFGDFLNRFYALNADARRQGAPATISASNGEWAFDTRAWVWASPVEENGVVYVATLGGEVYALDTQNGQPVWPAPAVVNGQVVGTPAFVETQRGRSLAVPSTKKNVAIIRLADGALQGDGLITDREVYSTPSVVGDFVFVHGHDGKLYTFSARSFERRACIELKNGEGKRCSA